MADLWHYTCQGQQMTPVSTAEIQRRAADGALLATDVVWREGMPSWVPANSVRELFEEPPGGDGRHLDRGAARELSTGKPPSKRRRWDGEGVPDIARRRPRSNRNKQMIVLWLGLAVGGTLLLILLVLGLFFIAFSAL